MARQLVVTDSWRFSYTASSSCATAFLCLSTIPISAMKIFNGVRFSNPQTDKLYVHPLMYRQYTHDERESLARCFYDLLTRTISIHPETYDIEFHGVRSIAPVMRYVNIREASYVYGAPFYDESQDFVSSEQDKLIFDEWIWRNAAYGHMQAEAEAQAGIGRFRNYWAALSNTVPSTRVDHLVGRDILLTLCDVYKTPFAMAIHTNALQNTRYFESSATETILESAFPYYPYAFDSTCDGVHERVRDGSITSMHQLVEARKAHNIRCHDVMDEVTNTLSRPLQTIAHPLFGIWYRQHVLDDIEADEDGEPTEDVVDDERPVLTDTQFEYVRNLERDNILDLHARVPDALMARLRARYYNNITTHPIMETVDENI